jgi:hypothetical protein
VAGNGSAPQFSVRPATNVQETDVVVLGVLPAKHRLVIQSAPVRSQAIRVGGGVFTLNTVGFATIHLVFHVTESGGGNPRPGNR